MSDEFVLHLASKDPKNTIREKAKYSNWSPQKSINKESNSNPGTYRSDSSSTITNVNIRPREISQLPIKTCGLNQSLPDNTNNVKKILNVRSTKTSRARAELNKKKQTTCLTSPLSYVRSKLNIPLKNIEEKCQIQYIESSNFALGRNVSNKPGEEKIGEILPKSDIEFNKKCEKIPRIDNRRHEQNRGDFNNLEGFKRELSTKSLNLPSRFKHDENKPKEYLINSIRSLEISEPILKTYPESKRRLYGLNVKNSSNENEESKISNNLSENKQATSNNLSSKCETTLQNKPRRISAKTFSQNKVNDIKNKTKTVNTSIVENYIIPEYGTPINEDVSGNKFNTFSKVNYNDPKLHIAIKEINVHEVATHVKEIDSNGKSVSIETVTQIDTNNARNEGEKLFSEKTSCDTSTQNLQDKLTNDVLQANLLKTNLEEKLRSTTEELNNTKIKLRIAESTVEQLRSQQKNQLMVLSKKVAEVDEMTTAALQERDIWKAKATNLENTLKNRANGDQEFDMFIDDKKAYHKTKKTEISQHDECYEESKEKKGNKKRQTVIKILKTVKKVHLTPEMYYKISR